MPPLLVVTDFLATLDLERVVGAEIPTVEVFDIRRLENELLEAGGAATVHFIELEAVLDDSVACVYVCFAQLRGLLVYGWMRNVRVRTCMVVAACLRVWDRVYVHVTCVHGRIRTCGIYA